MRNFRFEAKKNLKRNRRTHLVPPFCVPDIPVQYQYRYQCNHIPFYPLLPTGAVGGGGVGLHLVILTNKNIFFPRGTVIFFPRWQWMNELLCRGKHSSRTVPVQQIVAIFLEWVHTVWRLPYNFKNSWRVCWYGSYKDRFRTVQVWISIYGTMYRTFRNSFYMNFCVPVQHLQYGTGTPYLPYISHWLGVIRYRTPLSSRLKIFHFQYCTIPVPSYQR